jgi:hypothetical protein
LAQEPQVEESWEEIVESDYNPTNPQVKIWWQAESWPTLEKAKSYAKVPDSKIQTIARQKNATYKSQEIQTVEIKSQSKELTMDWAGRKQVHYFCWRVVRVKFYKKKGLSATAKASWEAAKNLAVVALPGLEQALSQWSQVRSRYGGLAAVTRANNHADRLRQAIERVKNVYDNLRAIQKPAEDQFVQVVEQIQGELKAALGEAEAAKNQLNQEMQNVQQQYEKEKKKAAEEKKLAEAKKREELEKQKKLAEARKLEEMEKQKKLAEAQKKSNTLPVANQEKNDTKPLDPKKSPNNPFTKYVQEVRKKEEQRKETERLAEIERQRKETERLAEIERQRKETERLAEIERQKERGRLAEIERQKEQERLAEIERQRERERLAELERQRKEAERLAEEERKRQEEVVEVSSDGRYKKSRNGVIWDTRTNLEWFVGPNQDTNWDAAR